VSQRESELLRIHQSLKQKEEESVIMSNELTSLRNEVNQLRRMSRRDGVNMEYLKNIVLQFICLRDDVSPSLCLVVTVYFVYIKLDFLAKLIDDILFVFVSKGQRRTLARVLETLLQFSPDEKRRVEDAYAGWGFEALWQLASPTKTIGPRS
jgi:isocitrate dehydrogenase kinase/phosphatase